MTTVNKDRKINFPSYLNFTKLLLFITKFKEEFDLYKN